MRNLRQMLSVMSSGCCCCCCCCISQHSGEWSWSSQS